MILSIKRSISSFPISKIHWINFVKNILYWFTEWEIFLNVFFFSFTNNRKYNKIFFHVSHAYVDFTWMQLKKNGKRKFVKHLISNDHGEHEWWIWYFFFNIILFFFKSQLNCLFFVVSVFFLIDIERNNWLINAFGWFSFSLHFLNVRWLLGTDWLLWALVCRPCREYYSIDRQQMGKSLCMDRWWVRDI